MDTSLDDSASNWDMPQVASLDELVEQLHTVFGRECVDVDFVQRLLATYVSNSDDWMGYAKFDRYKYTRNLVDEGNGKFNVMVLCWPESISSSIHDHTNSHCFMKVLQGELQEVRYRWPDKDASNQEMHEIARDTLALNEVCYINDSLGLHRVTNPSHSERAVSLHIYVPPFKACCAFDQRTGRRRTCQVTFWSQYGRRSRCSTSTSACDAKSTCLTSTGDN